MKQPSQIILQCLNCKKLFRVTPERWQQLLKKWASATNVTENYICRGCEMPLPTVRQSNNLFFEHASPEEEAALRQTMDGKTFNITAVKNFFKKMALLKRLYSHHPRSIKVLTEEDLKKFDSQLSETTTDQEETE